MLAHQGQGEGGEGREAGRAVKSGGGEAQVEGGECRCESRRSGHVGPGDVRKERADAMI